MGRSRNRIHVAQSLGSRLDFRKPDSALVLSADLTLGFWTHGVLVPLFLLYCLACLVRQYQNTTTTATTTAPNRNVFKKVSFTFCRKIPKGQ